MYLPLPPPVGSFFPSLSTTEPTIIRGSPPHTALQGHGWLLLPQSQTLEPAPSFAAASLLAAGPGGEAGRSTPLGRLLRAAGARSLLLAWATPFTALDGKQHRSADLLPSVLDYVQALLEKEEGPGGASALAVEAARSQTASTVRKEILIRSLLDPYAIRV